MPPSESPSPVDLTDEFWRNVFILCLVGSGELETPEAWAVEIRSRQHRATAQMREVAAQVPASSLGEHESALADGRFGDAFAALVTVAPSNLWPALAAVSETLGLAELIRDEQPPVTDPGYVHAAWVVHKPAADGLRE